MSQPPPVDHPQDGRLDVQHVNTLRDRSAWTSQRGGARVGKASTTVVTRSPMLSIRVIRPDPANGSPLGTFNGFDQTATPGTSLWAPRWLDAATCGL